MFDVLEHIRDRTALLGEVKRVLKPGGHLVLTLPALRALWSASDVSAGHFLRYSKRSIRRELESAGFTVIRARYFFVLTVVPLFILRALPYRFGRGPAISDEELVAKDIGFIGRIASRVEMLWARVGLVGSSLLVVARSNDSVR
jgi:SAM-dependent methyltransferase